MKIAKKAAVVFLAAISSLGLFAQENDPVLMKIAGIEIKRSEFEYAFNKNSVSQGEQGATVDE